MKIEYRGAELKTMEDWYNAAFVTGKKGRQWKEHRSAYSLADFILNKNGQAQIEAILSEVLTEEFELEKAEPEMEIRFDEFGHGREHDLVIEGKTKTNKPIFIGLEAKVDEPFGDTVATVYHRAKIKELNEKNTKAPARIEQLLKQNLKVVKEEDFTLRYQLLYSTVGTIGREKDSAENRVNILLILVFKTKDYNFEKGCDNKKDFYTFIRRIEATSLGNDTYKVTINKKELIIMYREISFLEADAVKNND